MKTFLKDCRNDSWVFDCQDKNLCYSKNGGKHQILLSDVKNDFDIITDDNGNFHMVLQTTDGSLLYLVYDFSNWKKYIILKSRSGSGEIRCFRLFHSKGRLHCLYLLEINHKTMLVHHIISGESSPSPEVISFAEASADFSCCMDLEGNIHILFFDQQNELSYKKFSQNRYQNLSAEIDDDIKSISAIFENQMHIVYTAKMKAYYTLTYFNPATKEKKVISFGETNMSDINISSENNIVCIQWREKNSFYKCESADGGLTFKKPSQIPQVRGKKTEVIRVRSASNPKCLCADKCLCFSCNGHIDILNSNYTGNKNMPNTKQNKKTEHTDIADGEVFDKLKAMQLKIRDNENEIVRLNKVISTLSNKINAISDKESHTPKTKDIKISPDKDKIGEINMENYKLFESTDIDSIEFKNSTKFVKE